VTSPALSSFTSQIVVENLRKTYRVAEKTEGRFAALTGMVRPRYRTVTALDGVSFALNAGELVGYIGPNGAGKSTTVKTLAGILVPDSGTCVVRGRVPWRERVAHVREIGVVFGQRTQLWWDLPVEQSFDLLRDIYRLAPDDYTRTKAELTERLNLASLLSVPARQLSLGQRMRCDLAAALLHTPAILFLDEPTIGLDAPSKLAVREFVQTLNKERGVTVILTTHDMDDIEALCSRVVLIGNGKIVLDGPLSHLRARVGAERYLVVEPANSEAEITDEEATILKRENGRITLCFDPRQTPTAVLIARVCSRYEVRDLLVQDPPIEQVIARFYEEKAK
jgi:ABC-2 type transport system ATP-binding protein